MSQVKLNPYVDLGLPMDPNSQQNNNSAQQSNDSGSSSQTSFGGISDLSSLTSQASNQQNTQQTPVAQSQTPNLYSAVNPKDVSNETIHITSSKDEEGDTNNNVFLIFAILFFLVSMGALVYFALKYFKLI